MLKTMYDRALFVLHRNIKSSQFHDVIKNKYLIYTQNENHLKNAELLDH